MEHRKLRGKRNIKRSLVALLVSAVMIMGLFPAVTFAANPVLHIAGYDYDNLAADINKSDEGWSWEAATNTLTLNGYNSDYIKYTDTAQKELKIVTAAGTNNTVAVPSDVNEHGICAD